ncbi:hypothetical protein C2G38_2173820 [Gigaspora rosea]|uniref:Uncharacterized protein n=1 Tax=Gigaspora rosea TaxID=44941 RepID=A0A397VU12_9GLOM|nr:hypothetical protein C2G38_2173820 [Gigaspora rosea]
MPLIFSEINGKDPDNVWKNINLKLYSAFGYNEKLKSPDDNEKKYCLQLILLLQNWAFANKYPVRTWLEKAINIFGKEELERLKNFESVGLIVQSKKRINNEEFKQIEKSKKSKVKKDGKNFFNLIIESQNGKELRMLICLGAEITESTN